MDKRSIKLLSIPALVCTLLASAALVFSSKAPNNTLANEMMASDDPYTLRVDGLSTSNKVLQTQNGNNINFAVSKYNNNTFSGAGAYIYNTTPISGLKSISIRSVSRVDYLIDYGWSTTFEARGYVPGSLNVNYNFNDENPSYFRIRCTYGPLEITSITLTYSCVETPKPDIYEFSYAMSTIDSGYAIAGYNGSATNVVIPTHYHGGMITTINPGAFANNKTIRSVTMPDTILYIEARAFQFCSALEEVVLPGWLNSIGNNAFQTCSSLTSFTMPNTVTSIGEYAFGYCSNLETIVMSNTLQTLGDRAFNGCSSLTSLVLPGSLTSIGNNTLTGCTALEELTLPFIGGSKTENQYLSYIFGGSSYSDNATKVPSSLKTLTIDANFPTIGERALYQCPMENIYFVNSYLRNIGNLAFGNCTNLKNITLPDGVETIGNSIFSGCSSLIEAYIPSSVQSIGTYILSNCSKLEKVSLPFVGSNREDSTNRRISYYTFNNGAPSTLQFITLLEGCTHLYDYAFQELRYVTTIYLPDSLTSVSSNSLIGNFVTTVHINYSASVYTLSRISSIYLLSDVYIHLDTNEHFFSVVNKMYLYYLSEENVHYINDNGEEYTHIDVVDGMKNISQYCFANCTSIVSISLPHSLTMLKGECAFYRCTSLETITYDGTVEEWNALERISGWNSGAPDIMVTCTNGSVSLLA